MAAELKKRREERVARNVKIIIRGYTSSAYVSAAGFSSNVEGRFYNSWPTTSTFTCSAGRDFCEYTGRILQGTQPRTYTGDL